MNSISSVIRNISSKNHSSYWRIQKYCVSLSQNSERMSSYKNKSSIYSLAAEKMHNPIELEHELIHILNKL
jgi:hypothetical protein